MTDPTPSRFHDFRPSVTVEGDYCAVCGDPRIEHPGQTPPYPDDPDAPHFEPYPEPIG